MTEVRARLAPGRAVEAGDFADLTGVEVDRVEFDETGAVVVCFAEAVPDDVAAAVRRRLVSETAREEQLRTEAEAFDATAADLAELRAQVARLTEIITGKG